VPDAEPHDHAVLATLAAIALCVTDIWAGALHAGGGMAADVVGWAASPDLPGLADGHARLGARSRARRQALRDEPATAAVRRLRRRSRPPVGGSSSARRAGLAGHAGRGARRRRPRLKSTRPILGISR
jgi:hypothetical protein